MIRYLILIAFPIMTACHTPAAGTGRTPLTDSFDKQGHRGCRGLYPENTVAAMLQALALGVTTLEMDVCVTADNQVVLSHEPFFNHEISRHPDGRPVSEAEEKSLNIFRMTYAEVSRYDVGLAPHPRFPRQVKMAAVKPRLADLLDSVKQYMMMARRPFPYFNIETKSLPEGDDIYHPKPDKFVELLMQVIRDKQLEDFVIIQSFDPRTLQYIHQKYPAIRTALLMEADDKRSLKAQLRDLGFTPTVYSPAWQRVNATLVADCHQRGMKIIPWTVNEAEKIRELKSMGVDGIITDYPDLFE